MSTLKTVEVHSHLGSDFLIETRIRDHLVLVDQGRAGGGEDRGPSPLEYQLVALAGCIGSIARIVAHQRRLALRGMDIHVSGQLDPAVLLGKHRDGRAGFHGFTVTVTVDADLTQAEKEDFLHEVDRRCPISDNLLSATPVELVVR